MRETETDPKCLCDIPLLWVFTTLYSVHL